MQSIHSRRVACFNGIIKPGVRKWKGAVCENGIELVLSLHWFFIGYWIKTRGWMSIRPPFYNTKHLPVYTPAI